MDNDTSVQPQPFIIEGTRNGGSPVRTTGRLDSYGVGKLPAAWWFPAPRGVEFQCPHGLELLLNLLLQFRLIFLFQCPHGLELLPVPKNMIFAILMFQCPHGLELLLNWPSIVAAVPKSFNALMGLSCYCKNVQYFKFFMILFMHPCYL